MMTLPAAELRLRPLCGLSESVNNGPSVWMMHRTDVHVVLASSSKARVHGNPPPRPKTQSLVVWFLVL